MIFVLGAISLIMACRRGRASVPSITGSIVDVKDEKEREEEKEEREEKQDSDRVSSVDFVLFPNERLYANPIGRRPTCCRSETREVNTSNGSY